MEYRSQDVVPIGELGNFLGDFGKECQLGETLLPFLLEPETLDSQGDMASSGTQPLFVSLREFLIACVAYHAHDADDLVAGK